MLIQDRLPPYSKRADKWTPEDEQILWAAAERGKHIWKEMKQMLCKDLPGRSLSACQKRYDLLQKSKTNIKTQINPRETSTASMNPSEKSISNNFEVRPSLRG